MFDITALLAKSKYLKGKIGLGPKRHYSTLVKNDILFSKKSSQKSHRHSFTVSA